MGHEVRLQLLAASDCDPRWRYRWQPANGARSELDRSSSHAESPRIPSRARLLQRCVMRDADLLLRDRQLQLYHEQPRPWTDGTSAPVHELFAGASRCPRCPRLRRHALPELNSQRGDHWQAGLPLCHQTLLLPPLTWLQAVAQHFLVHERLKQLDARLPPPRRRADKFEGAQAGCLANAESRG